MVEFCQMKSLLAIAFRFLITFIVVDLCLTVAWTTGAALDHGLDSVRLVLGGVLVSAMPASVVAAIFISFFLVNRVYSSRIAGYAVLAVVSAAAAAGAGLLVRFVGSAFGSDVSALPSLYKPVAEWFRRVSMASWAEFSVGLGTFALMNAACWSLTRLSRNRPLFGAFVAPGAALAVLYLFSIYLSGPADAVFRLAGIDLSRTMTTSALAACTTLGLVLFDALFAMKPAGAPRHG
jgi:hypothetical protein